MDVEICLRVIFMLTLGIDPGIAISGYGLVQRLKILYEGFMRLIDTYRPDSIAVEELFFNKNAKTIITVGEARGIALLSGSLSDIEVYEYTPLQVKQAVVGYGRADKNQVQNMVKILLNLEDIPKPDDAADALATAICHLNTTDFNTLCGRGRGNV